MVPLPRCGFWLRPGSKHRGLKVMESCQIILGETPEETPAHGHFHEWCVVNDLTQVMLCFHDEGANTVEKLVDHLLEKITAGIYRAGDRGDLLLFPEEMSPCHELVSNGCLYSLNIQLRQRAKHLFLWLHPGANPQFLALTQDGKCLFQSRQQVSVENGYFEYGVDPNSGEEYMYVNFHYRGETPAPTTILRRLSSTVWRATGDHEKIYEDSELMLLKKWHIVAIMLS